MSKCSLLLVALTPLIAQLDRIPPPNTASPLARNPATVETGQRAAPSRGFRGTGHTLIAGQPGQFCLRALDGKTGALRWEFPMPGPTTRWAGTVSTAGGLVWRMTTAT